MQPVIFVLVWIAVIKQIQREQREEPIGSKRWQLAAVVFLGFLMIGGLVLLGVAADSR